MPDLPDFVRSSGKPICCQFGVNGGMTSTCVGCWDDDFLLSNYCEESSLIRVKLGRKDTIKQCH